MVRSYALTILLLFGVSAFAADNKVTAQDQSNAAADTELTRKIRKELMSTDLSMSAKNITIVTVDGMVTLKGNVSTAKEKATVGQIANRVAPNVRNDVVVKK